MVSSSSFSLRARSVSGVLARSMSSATVSLLARSARRSPVDRFVAIVISFGLVLDKVSKEASTPFSNVC